MARVGGRGWEKDLAPGLRGWSAAGVSVLIVVSVSVLHLTGPEIEPSTSSASIRAVTTRGSVTLVGHTPEQSERVYDVLDRFAVTGLNLPHLTIRFWPSRDHCDGMGGWHRRVGEITVCLPTARMIAHEIAHAWDAHNLSDADREAYRELWGAPTWNSREFEWPLRAAELAANTIAFAVLNEDPEPHQQIRAFLCTYENLTGMALPTSLDPPCSSTDPRDQIADPWWVP